MFFLTTKGKNNMSK